jgi:hypothetical protein
MNAVVYLFQVSACMGIFYMFYYLLLSRYTFFTINRWYLIITLALCFVIPLLTITVQQQETYPQVIQQVVYINQMQMPQQVVVTNQAPAQVQINWMALLKVFYTASVAALFLRLMFIVVKFFTRIRNKKRTKIGGVNIVQGDDDLSNGSFFNYIFLNDDELSADELEQIIAHEMLHVKLYHSVDRILIKIAQVFLWFNPFVYLYARAIEENHEFEVDRAVSSSTDRNKYAELLFHLSVARQGTLYHSFSMVPLKKRITMLFTKPTNRIKKIIYLLVVPVVLISCLAFAKLKNESPAKTKKQAMSEILDSTETVKYRQKSKLTPAQRAANEEGFKKMRAYFDSPEGKKKVESAKAVMEKTVTFEVEDDAFTLTPNPVSNLVVKGLKLKNEVGSYSMYPKKGLKSLKKGDVIAVKVLATGYNRESPLVNIMPEWVTKDGKKIYEAEKIKAYPFGYEANKVRFSYGKFSKIEKYANGKWKTAVYESAGYKFNLTFKPNAPDLNKIKLGDDITLRFIHEVKTGDKTYNINDWVAISTDIKDYGIKNPEWFYKFYEVVKADTGKISAIGGIEGLGPSPLVLINDKEYPKDILYKISTRGIRASSFYPPNNGTTKYGEKAKDGAVVILTRDGEINYLTNTERQNLLKQQAAKGKFFSRITLTNEDGSKYDVARITRATGSGASANMETNGKIAFIINNKLYNEAQFKRLFKKDKASYGPSIGVGGGSKELTDRGFNLDGYDLVFEFDPGATSKVTNAPVKTGAIVPGKNGNNKTGTGGAYLVASKTPNTPQYRSWSSGTNPGIGKPALTGGQSDFRGNKIIPIGFTFRYPRVSKPEYVKPGDESKKQGETGPEGKDTVGNTKKALNEAMANLSELEVRADGSTWFKGQPVKRILVNGKEYMGGDASRVLNTLPAEIIDKVKVSDTPKILVDGKEFIPTGVTEKKVTNTPKILVDGKEFIPTGITEKVKVTNTPKILVDGKEFIPNNIDTKKDLLNSVPR